MNLTKTNQKLFLVLIFLLGIAIIVLPFILRAHNNDPLFTRGRFYFDLRAAQDLSQGQYWDTLQGRIHEISLFHYILSSLLSWNLFESLMTLSIIFGLLSMFVFFVIIRDMFEEKEIVLISMLLLILSPIFIYLFTGINSYSLATFLSLLFIYFMLRKSYWSILFIVLISITEFSFFLINISLLIIFAMFNNNKKLFWYNVIPSVLASGLFAYFHKGFIILNRIFSEPSFLKFFTSFGAGVGIAFFYLFIGIIGFFTLWKRRRSYMYILVSFLILFVFSIFNPAGRIFLNFYLCVFSGQVIFFFIKRDWEIETIKKFTLLLIFCGIIFSTSLYLDQLIKSEPKQDFEDALSYLNKRDDGLILSYQGYGYFIEYFSDKPSFTDDSTPFFENYHYLKDTEKAIFSSRKLDEANSLLKENNIKYILITPEMKQGLIWNREQEGLLFLIENTDLFKELYSKNDILVLEYQG